ncbi:DgyrCDS12452 [Dimorphilus gyrociliatus]|uniref:DgyrCDS12452 n=1 Tax=Dimorphilus gyrociliatus TaxID=2664684 RepID=A0A7I8W6H6_9ANNE|nr:DgyrCDS12452 [Dimorphilus gyrociliatus]
MKLLLTCSVILLLPFLGEAVFDVDKCFQNEVDFFPIEASTAFENIDSLSSCQLKCLTIEGICRSIWYNETNRICYILKDWFYNGHPELFSNKLRPVKKRNFICQPDCYMVKATLPFSPRIDKLVKFMTNSSEECRILPLIMSNQNFLVADYLPDESACILRQGRHSMGEDKYSYEKKCNYINACFDKTSNKLLKTSKTVIKLTKTFENCVYSCLTSEVNSCKYFNYAKENQLCFLYKGDKTDYVETKVGWDFYEKKSFCKSHCTFNQTTPPQNGTIAQITIKKPVFSTLHCLIICLSSLMGCKYITYDPKTFSCYLSYADEQFPRGAIFEKEGGKCTTVKEKLMNKLKYKKGMTLLSKLCLNDERESVENHPCFKPYYFRGVQGPFYKSVIKPTTESCYNLCLREENFYCKSGTYFPIYGICSLRSYSEPKKPNSHFPFPMMTYLYFERTERCRPDCLLKKTVGVHRNYIRGSVKSIKAKDQEDCVTQFFINMGQSNYSDFYWNSTNKKCAAFQRGTDVANMLPDITSFETDCVKNYGCRMIRSSKANITKAYEDLYKTCEQNCLEISRSMYGKKKMKIKNAYFRYFSKEIINQIRYVHRLKMLVSLRKQGKQYAQVQ